MVDLARTDILILIVVGERAIQLVIGVTQGSAPGPGFLGISIFFLCQIGTHVGRITEIRLRIGNTGFTH